MFKAVVSDLDGTLLNAEHKVSEFTRETVELLLKKGIKFYIATGRNYLGAKEAMDELGVKVPLITSHGSVAFDENGNEIFSNNLKREYLDKVLDIDYKSFGKDIIITGYSGPNWFVTEDLREYFYNKKPDRTRYPKQITPEEFKKHNFTKIFFLGEDHDELLELENEIRKAVGDGNISLLFANEGSLEVFSANCNKAKAAEVLLERDGLTLKDAVSFGDGLNDYELITETGLGFAMGNSIYLLLEELTDTPVELGISSEWGYGMPLLSKKPLFIFISQSGETADSRQVLVKANEMGIPSLTVTNVPGSTLSREANHTMLLHAGPEIAVASTKAYTAQIAALAFLAKAVGDANASEKAAAFDLVHELSLVAQSIESTLSEKELIESKVDNLLGTTRNAFYIGRGQDYYVAMEASLKLKEISYIQCEGFAAGELKHGTIALIEEGTPVLALLSDPVLANHTRGNIQEVAARGANVLTIAEENVAKDNDDIVLSQVHPYLSPISMVVPTQLVAYYATLHRGLDVDKPRNLAKSVTVE